MTVPPFPLDPGLPAAYDRDGIVCVRGALDPAWVERMRGAVERVLAAPSEFGERYGDPARASFLGDKFMWMRDPDFRDFAMASTLPAIAAGLVGSPTVNLFYDHLLVKEPGSDVPTRWHHDQNYWPCVGSQCLSIWVALDRVDAGNGRVEFIRGSHRWKQRFQPMNFTDMAPIADPDYEPIPDIEADRAAYDIVAYDLEPGDCVVFSALTVHGASGNAAGDRRRRAVAVRYTGDDVRFAVKRAVIKLPTDPGLAHGDRMGGAQFPLIAVA